MFKQLRTQLTEKGREYKDAAVTAGLKAVTAVVTTSTADSGPVVADVRAASLRPDNPTSTRKSGSADSPPLPSAANELPCLHAPQIFRREDESLVLVPRNPAASALRVFAAVSMRSPTKLDVGVSFEATTPAPSDAHCGELNAVLGVISLGDDRWPVPHLIVVTSMRAVTNVLAAPCYKISDVALLQLGGKSLLDCGSALQRSKLDSDMTSMRLFLNTGGLFVAPGIDLSRPMQEAQSHPDDPWQVRQSCMSRRCTQHHAPTYVYLCRLTDAMLCYAMRLSTHGQTSGSTSAWQSQCALVNRRILGLSSPSRDLLAKHGYSLVWVHGGKALSPDHQSQLSCPVLLDLPRQTIKQGRTPAGAGAKAAVRAGVAKGMDQDLKRYSPQTRRMLRWH